MDKDDLEKEVARIRALPEAEFVKETEEQINDSRIFEVTPQELEQEMAKWELYMAAATDM